MLRPPFLIGFHRNLQAIFTNQPYALDRQSVTIVTD